MKSNMQRLGMLAVVLGVGLMFLSLLPAEAEAQVTQEWVVRYNGTANTNDMVGLNGGGIWETYGAIVVDASGNSYVTGYSHDQVSGENYVTIKYDTHGNQVWLARYVGSGSSSASALTVDPAGNVYVTGTSVYAGNEKYATVKYDSNGNQLWVSEYDGPASNAGDEATAIAVDLLGNVYVTGGSWGACGHAGCWDYATIKYDTNGNQLWVRRYDGPSDYFDYAYALAVDAAGNVYVTGGSQDADPCCVSLPTDYATIKYDTNGNQLWVARYNGGPSCCSADVAYAMALDTAGNAYVTGKSGNANSNDDYTTIKYDPNGNQLWVARYDGPGHGFDKAYALKIDSMDNVYVTGTSVGVGSSEDYATIKYDANGSQLWVARFNGPGNTNDLATSLAVDPSGNAYVTGYTDLSILAPVNYSTIKYDANGNQMWLAHYNGPGNGADYATAIGIDSAGNVYVSGGSTGSGTGLDYATIKYAQDEVTVPNPAPATIYLANQNEDAPSIVAVDPATDTVTASIPVSGTPGELVAHPDGSTVYAVTGTDLSVIDVATNQVVNTSTGVGDFFNLLAISSDGNRLYLAYRQLVPATLKIKVFDTTDPTTPTLMTTVSSGMWNGCYGALGLAVSPDGSQLYMACRIGAAGNPDRFYMIDTATNTPVQTATYPRENTNYMFINALAVTPDGSRVYLARAHSEGSTVEYFNGTTGARMGAIALPANALPRAAAFTPDGNKLYVTDQVLGTHVINPATNTRTATLPQSKSRGLDIAMTADAHAYTTLLFEIHDLNAATNSWVATIGAPEFNAAYQITATPGHP